MGNFEEVKKRKETLISLLESARKKKKEVICFVNNLARELSLKKITKREYSDKISDYLNYKSPEEWIKYYDEYIQDCQNKIFQCDTIIEEEKAFSSHNKRVKVLNFLILIVFIGIIISVAFNFGPVIYNSFNKAFFEKSTHSGGIVVLSADKSANVQIPTSSEIASFKPFTPMIISKNSNPDFSINTIQSPAVVGSNVKWDSNINMKSTQDFQIDIPAGSKVIGLKDGNGNNVINQVKINNIGKVLGVFGSGTKLEISGLKGGESYNIEFETPAPEISGAQEIQKSGERVAVNSDIHYENILSSVNISEKLNIKMSDKEKLKIYEIVNDNGIEKRIPIYLEAYDTNEDRIVDKIEWVTPHLSSAVFEIVIEISNAIHLDSNKNFISDIYDFVKAQDGNWSEPIYNNEYVRAKFSQALDNSKDITFYARNLQGLNTTVEVYSIESNEKIAEFPVITSEGKYKVLLTAMKGSSDTFDLKIKNLDYDNSAYLEFDYIVDPSSTPFVWVPSGGNVTKLTTAGAFVGSYPVGSPAAIAIDASGNVWVANSGGNNVTKLTNAGVIVGNYSVGSFPQGIAVDASGNVWVTNYGGNSVTKLSNAGALLGTYTVGRNPTGIAVDASGNVWVANGVSNNVTKLTNAGVIVGNYSVGSFPTGIAVDDSGNIWVVDHSSNAVTKLSNAGALVGTYNVGSGPGGIAIDASGNIWVANYGGNNVTKLTNAGVIVGNYSVGSYPVGVSVDSSGNIWVAGTGSITKLSNAGALMGTYSGVSSASIGDMTGFALQHFVLGLDNPYSITDCGVVLNNPNMVYTLANNIINNSLTSDCIKITATNVTLDCKGFYIKSTSSNNGVYSNQDYTQIKNCNISVSTSNAGLNIMGNYFYIFNNTLNGQWAGVDGNINHSKLENNTANNDFYGIFIHGLNNTLIGNTANFDNPYGIILTSPSNNYLLINNTANSNPGIGMYLQISNSILDGNTANNNSQGGIILSSGSNNALLRMTVNNNSISGITFNTGSSNNQIIDSNISLNLKNDTILKSNSVNNTFINCSYNLSNEYIESGSQLIRKWYYRAYVKDSGGVGVSYANITSFNVTTLANIFNLTTNSSGWTNITTIIEYVNFGAISGVNRSYYSNYTINATNGTLRDEHKFNVTLQGDSNQHNNLSDVFTISQVICGINQVCDCGAVLNSPNTVYTLAGNIINNSLTSDCITIIATNVTLDCKGFFIKSDDPFGGISINNGDNANVKNCNITMGKTGGGGIIINSNYAYIFNNTLNSNYYGISLSSNYNTLYLITANNNSFHGINLQSNSNNNLSNIITNSNGNSGIYLDSSSNNNLSDIIANNNSNSGILIYSNSNNNNLASITANNNSNYGIYIPASSGNVIMNSNLSGNIKNETRLETSSLNNNFINCTYNLSKEYVDSTSQLIRRWYYRAYVKNSGGVGAPNTNISAYNVTTLANIFNLTTNSTGWTNITTIIDYINNGGIKNYYSNYIINATNGTHKDEHLYNVTSQGDSNQHNNLSDVFTLVPPCGINQVCDCGAVLNNPNTVYTLAANITRNDLIDNCINITAVNVTLDCNGKYIKGNNRSGIYSNQLNTTIKNCNISMGSLTNNYGIFLLGANYSYIINNTLNSNYHGIYSAASSNCTFINNTVNSNNNAGINLNGGSNNNILINNTVALNNFYGFYFSSANNNYILNNNISKNSNTGIAFYGSSNNTFQDSIFKTNSVYDVYLSSASLNNSFINCTYSSEYNSGSQLIRKWYYRAYVNNSGGIGIPNVNVSAYNVTTLANIFNLTTNSSGWTNITTIIDYVNNSGIMSYYSNYTINATNGTLKGSHTFNASLGNNLKDVFTLSFSILLNESSETSNLSEWRMRGRYLNHTAWDGINYYTIPGLNQTSFLALLSISSSPAVAKGYVYVGSDDGNLYQLNATNVSQIIANYSTKGTIYFSSPAVANGYVYIGSADNNLYQLNASNVSQKIANYSTKGTIYSSPAVANGYVYFGSADENVYQLNATNVSQKIANYTTRDFIISSPAVANGFVYIGSNDKNLYQLNATNISQKIANYTTLDFIISSPAVANGFVYIGSNDNNLYQLNATNVSQRIANYSTKGDIYSSPAVANGYVYVGSYDNYLYQLNATNVSQRIANYSTGGYIVSSPAVANGYVYFGSADNSSYQLNATNISQKIASYTTGSFIESSPAVANGYVYIGSGDKNLYQLNATNISLGNSCGVNQVCDCGAVLNQSNTVYTLGGNIIRNDLTDNCINITAENVTLDCNLKYINSNDSYAGIYSENVNNITIKNCIVTMDYTEGYGIRLNNISNSLIVNNTLNSNYDGIFISLGSNNIFTTNLITNFSSGGAGIYLDGLNSNSMISYNTILSNNSATTGVYSDSSTNLSIDSNAISVALFGSGIRLSASNSNSSITSNNITINAGYSYGIYPYSSSGLDIISNNITIFGDYSNSLYSIYLSNSRMISNDITVFGDNSYGIFLTLSNSNLFASNNIHANNVTANGAQSTYDVYLTYSSTNNTFLNCTYDLSKEYVEYGSQLIRKWYYQAYVNDTNGYPVPNANVSAYNVNNSVEFLGLLTNSSGWTNITTITEYIGNGGIEVPVNRSYYSNYTINATNWTLKDEHMFNVTSQGDLNQHNNLADVFTLNTPDIHVPIQIIYVEPISDTFPVSGGVNNVHVNFSVYDGIGYSDINSSSARANFSRNGVIRQNISCNFVNGNGNIGNYSCIVPMWFFDSSGYWNISIFISDLEGNSGINDTQQFHYNILGDWIMIPGSLNWSNLKLGVLNQIADNNLTIYNLGNLNITQVMINSSNLIGESDNSYNIRAGNFSIDGCTNKRMIENQNVLSALTINYTQSTINSNASGNLTFCIPSALTNVKRQSYSSSRYWGIDVTFALASFALVKRKKKKEKKTINKNKLLEILEQNKKEVLDLVKEELIKFKSEINKEDIKNDILIPINIFKEDIGAAEVLSKYLHEEKKMKFSEIAKLVNRNQRTIWVNYNNSLKKKRIEFIEDGIMVPVSIFSERRLSILEALISHLREKGMKNNEIALMLGKDPRNIGTFYSRARKK